MSVTGFFEHFPKLTFPSKRLQLMFFLQWLKTADEDDGEGEAPADILEDQQKVKNFCKFPKQSDVFLKTRLLFK